jgi:hypothetical protein
MNAIEQLKSVLCDHAGKCSIIGSDEDRAIVDRALQAIAAQPAVPLADEQIEAAVRDWHGSEFHELEDEPSVIDIAEPLKPHTASQIKANHEPN